MNSELRQAVERVRECFDAAFIEDCGEWCALSDAIRELETITEGAEYDTMQADNNALSRPYTAISGHIPGPNRHRNAATDH